MCTASTACWMGLVGESRWWRAAELGLPAVALTVDGALYGAVSFRDRPSYGDYYNPARDRELLHHATSDDVWFGSRQRSLPVKKP